MMSIVVRLILISLCWVVFEIGSGFIAGRLPRRLFDRDSMLFRSRRWEQKGRIYQRLFRIRRWKDRLPEAGAMFPGGVSKRQLRAPTKETLELSIAETRRAELTHWLPVLLSFSFFAWNPPSVAVWMPLIGFLGNAPFIAVQRHLRPRFVALLSRSE